MIFTGNRRDMPEVLNALDVLVSLSGGSVMFEGMACGKCVVSAGFTSREDAVHLRDGETGILLNSQQPEMLSTTLQSLLGNPVLRANLGCQARLWVEEKLDRRHMAKAMQRLYTELLNAGRPIKDTDFSTGPISQCPAALPLEQGTPLSPP